MDEEFILKINIKIPIYIIKFLNIINNEIIIISQKLNYTFIF
jgi:hypothetical protein